jgi:hypothetical protein
MTARLRPSRRSRPLPRPLRWSIAAWLAAVAFGVAETLVRLALPDPPTAGELVVRSAVYVLVAVSVLALSSGRAAVRAAVAVLVGGVGTLSLAAEPVQWLAAGGSPVAYLASADVATLLIVALRTAHLLAVLVALVLLFGPRANAYFRAPTSPMPAAAAGRGLSYGNR